MSEPTSRTPPCEHFEEYGEGCEWPIEISLEHFDDCLTPEDRLRRWEQARGLANRATSPVIHKPFDDDGVTYCGWATGSQIIDGCGEVWPCAVIRAQYPGDRRQ